MKELATLPRIKESLTLKKILLICGATSCAVLWVPMVLVLASCACFRPASSGERGDYEVARQELVTVYLDGDVKFYGNRKMKRELSEASILEASGGFAGLSQIRPKSITLKRGTHSYGVRFSELGTGRWKNFLLQDGDEIVVNKVFF
jgi:hypothetical protein